MKFKLNPKHEAVSIAILAASFVAAWYFYIHSPALVASHWDYAGHVNGYMNRFWGNFFLPLMMLGLYLILLAAPFLDPRKKRYEAFAGIYNLFKAAILGAIFAIQIATGLYNTGHGVNIAKTVSLIVGLLLLVMGNYMGKIQSNFFVGIRTPWTLSSEDVWNKTNRFGGRFMMLFGLLVIISPYLPEGYGIALFIAGAVMMSLGSMVYSYLLYRREQK